MGNFICEMLMRNTDGVVKHRLKYFSNDDYTDRKRKSVRKGNNWNI